MYSLWPFFPSIYLHTPLPQLTYTLCTELQTLLFLFTLLLPCPQTCPYTDKDNDICFIPGFITTSTSYPHPHPFFHTNICPGESGCLRIPTTPPLQTHRYLRVSERSRFPTYVYVNSLTCLNAMPFFSHLVLTDLHTYPYITSG